MNSPAEAVGVRGPDLSPLWGVQVRVGEPGMKLTADDGEVFTLEKGSGVGQGRTLWLVQSDYDALKAALPTSTDGEAE